MSPSDCFVVCNVVRCYVVCKVSERGSVEWFKPVAEFETRERAQAAANVLNAKAAVS